MSIDEYIKKVQDELDAAVRDTLRLEGALAMLRKMKADKEAESKEVAK